MPSVSPKRKIIGFPGLLLLQRRLGALNQLLRGYFCSNLMFDKNLVSVPTQVLWIFESMGGSSKKMLSPPRDQQTQWAGKYATEICGMSWHRSLVILSTSRYLFSFEMIKVLCSVSPEMLAANCWFCFINYCHWSNIEPRSAVMHCRASCLSEPQPMIQGLGLNTKINRQTSGLEKWIMEGRDEWKVIPWVCAGDENRAQVPGCWVRCRSTSSS